MLTECGKFWPDFRSFRFFRKCSKLFNGKYNELKSKFTSLRFQRIEQSKIFSLIFWTGLLSYNRNVTQVFRFTWIIFISCLVNLELAEQIWQLNFCFHFICLQISRKFNAKNLFKFKKKSFFFDENLWAEANICVFNDQIKIEINIEFFQDFK